jgi:hypothetical protein
MIGEIRAGAMRGERRKHDDAARGSLHRNGTIE